MAVVGSLIVNVLGNTAPLAASLAAARGEVAAFSNQAAAHGQATVSAFNAVRGAAIVAGAGAVAFGALSVRAAADFQEQMAIINTIAHQTPEELTRTGTAIRGMAASSGESLSSLTSAFYDLLSAGVPVSQAMSVLNSSVTLAIGGLATTKETVNLLTGAMNGYGLTTKGVTVAMDQFALAVQDGKVTAAEISNTFANVAPLARQYGIGIDEIATAYATLTAKNVPAAEVTTQMQRAILELIKPSTQLRDLQEEIGVNFADVAAHQGLVVALQQIREAAAANNVPFQSLFGRVEGLNFALATTGPNFRGYQAELVDMQNATGTAAGQAAERMDTFDRTTARLGISVQNLMINVGTALLPAVTSLANAIIPIVSQFAQWAGAHAELVGPILATVAAVGALAAATLVLGPLIGAISLPLLAVGAAIAGLAAAWANNWGNIRGVVANVVGWIQTNLVPVFQRVQAGMAQAMAWIQANVGPVFQRVMATVGQAVGWVVANVFPAFQRAVGAISSWVQANWPLISSVAGQVFGAVGNVISVAGRVIANVVTTVWPVLMRIANVLFPVIGVAATVLLRVIDGAFRLIGGIFRGLGVVAHAVSTGIGTTWRALTGVFNAVTSGIRVAVGIASGVINGLLGVVKTVADAIAGFFGWIGQGVKAAQDQLASVRPDAFGHPVTRPLAVRPPTTTTPVVRAPATTTTTSTIIGTRNIPTFQHGGVIPGSGPQLIVGHGGETVTPRGSSERAIELLAHLVVELDGEKLTDVIERRLFRNASGYSSGFSAGNPITAA
jgi:TP901 family phage tail tape measure protein